RARLRSPSAPARSRSSPSCGPPRGRAGTRARRRPGCRRSRPVALRSSWSAILKCQIDFDNPPFGPRPIAWPAMQAPGPRGPVRLAIGAAAAACGLIWYASDIWREYRAFAVLAAVGAVVCVLLALYNLLTWRAHAGTELNLQGLAWPGGKLV